MSDRKQQLGGNTRLCRRGVHRGFDPSLTSAARGEYDHRGRRHGPQRHGASRVGIMRSSALAVRPTRSMV